jgi:TrmH family RNA methyltransferase
MARRILITSSSNPRLKAIRRLKRDARRNGVFLVEGYRQVACALEAGAKVRELYVAAELYLGDCEEELASFAERRGAVVHELSAAAFESISGQVRADGISAVVERWPTTLDRLRLGPIPLLVVAEGVERPGNLGTIIRTTCGAGADALVVCDGRTDPFHPETVRGSVGTLFKLPLAESDPTTTISWLRERRIRVVVATPDAPKPYWDVDLGGPTALVVGNERHGVSQAWLSGADATVQIPMPGPADSLNVAVAAGVVIFEAAHQRGFTKSLQPRR